ncbi:MAG: hypothetical protein E7213_03425 [Clostridium sp.]|nr:hypothetical protein [Clostridium sp.]
MKFSKKFLILVIIAVGVFTVVSINNPLPNIKISEIKDISIYHNNDLKICPPSSYEGETVLELVKDILKESSLGENQGEFINDNFIISISKANSDNHYVEIPFSRTEKLSLKDETITCDVIVICPEEGALYYHEPESYTVKKVTLKNKNANFYRLHQFVSSLY